MPDSTGKLTPEEHQRAINWINLRWKRGVTCEMCGQRHIWTIGTHLVATTNVMMPSAIRLTDGTAYPSFIVFCTYCGNTKLVNALISGVVSTPEVRNG